MASACMPLTYVRIVSPAVVTDSRLIAKHVQCTQMARLSTQASAASRACSWLLSTKKSRGHAVLAFENSDYKPFTVEELEGTISSNIYSEPGSSPVESDSNSLGFDSASPEDSDISSESVFSEVQPPRLTKLYVGNLPWDYDNQQLEELFKEHGSVFVAEVVLDKVSERSRGFGFVYMNTPQDAEIVIQKLNGKEVGGRNLKVNYQETAEARSQRLSRGGGYGEASSNVNRIFVANLPWSATDQDLELLFSDYGTVVQAKVVIERETGRSKGFGFVTFSSAEEVSKAISGLNGSEYEGRPLRVALAENKPAVSRSFY
ncbi:hypothetical protein O6H91_11G037500 [Diphasiastrum complanatum]|uniref:Uncharacterized protein n=4 Tax=Diphasiastrum complanatum TaxID=34168 RepID=A0ACC2C870_DIPCM|nr:hypothetical protein O6H91_11G036800 [Diphasiastrum complanatum]KAJ7538166.1 hypothetical protein O6H91_11G036800 [Diphasiastrum complanatum]KAJ7538167.1 hypothetical protein O6H91_11G036800 [Diphasiastrum complanatum]KAJ7538186.1 hypothetical protein O6H91_11G037500 [Diphasiastrum complanatum]